MNVPTNWLKDYLGKTDITTKEMADVLEAGGIEVEQIKYATKLDEQIIVAEIKKVTQHPNADKLNLAIVDSGAAEIEVVCGAPNLKTGMKVAFAQVGAKLPDGTIIKAATIRGQSSQGMLCSARELGLGDDHDGILPLTESAKLGEPVNLIFSSEDVINVSTQANRFDLLSLVGLAREVAAQTDSEVKLPPSTKPEIIDRQLEVKIEAKEAVNRYMLVGLSFNQSHGTAPAAVSRLEAAGSRSINLPVDLTNYTMIETGQPLHAFDATKTKLPIIVRHAAKGEVIETLDGVRRTLTAQDLVIADADGPIALAGVMGGRRTEVDAKTTEILLEVASFDGAIVRKMAQRHGLRSEASARFERNLPVALCDFGLERALYSFKMAVEAKQTTAVFDQSNQKPVVTQIVITASGLSKILSIDIKANDIVKQLTKLGFIVRPDGTNLTVEVPWWRPDVKLAEDLAEEYIRLIGFEDVPARLPIWHPTESQTDSYWPNLWQAKAALKALGLFEVITYSFVSKAQLEQFGYKPSDHLKLNNPMSVEQAYLRQNLLPSLATSLVRNQGYRPEFGLYEVSHVFIPTKPGTQPLEPKQLGVLIKGHQAYSRAKQALDALTGSFNAKLTVHPEGYNEFLPGQSAAIKADKTVIGRIGTIHPSRLSDLRGKTPMAYLELDLEQLFAAAQPKKYQAISRFPSIFRDLTVIVKRDVLWQDVESAIKSTDVAKVSFLSDYYDDELGDDHKTISMRLEMSSLTGTLTDKEADKRLEKIIGLLKHRFDAKERS